MRRIIACVIIGLVTAIAFYHLIKQTHSTNTGMHMPMPRGNDHRQDKVVISFPLPVHFKVYE